MPEPVRRIENYIDGRWVAVGQGDALDVLDPSDGSTIARVPLIREKA